LEEYYIWLLPTPSNKTFHIPITYLKEWKFFQYKFVFTCSGQLIFFYLQLFNNAVNSSAQRFLTFWLLWTPWITTASRRPISHFYNSNLLPSTHEYYHKLGKENM
jgi:hypothetical protein